MQTDFSVITHNSALCQGRTPLRWIVPDSTNRRLEEITDRKKADGTPGGGSSGSMAITLPRIEPYFGTQFFLVDIETGELFALIQQQWRRTGLSCAEQPFLITQLMEKVERMGQITQAEFEAEQQTAVVLLQRSQGQFEVPPPLPVMDEPEVYVTHQDVMDTNMRKNYVRDRMRAALIIRGNRGKKAGSVNMPCITAFVDKNSLQAACLMQVSRTFAKFACSEVRNTNEVTLTKNNKM